MAVSLTPQQMIEQLDSGLQWPRARTTITFAFAQDVTRMVNVSGYAATFQPLTSLGVTLTTQALKAWDDLIPQSFVQVNAPAAGGSGADIEFALYRGPTSTGGKTLFPSVGSVWFNVNAGMDWPEFGKFTYRTLLHEIGHALGLDHMGNYDGPGATPSHFTDSDVYSVMSYFGPGTLDGFNQVAWRDWTDDSNVFWSPQTPMPADILAIQAMYGISTTTRLGDTVYGFNTNVSAEDRPLYDFTLNSRPVMTIFDSGGIDTLDLSGFHSQAWVILQDRGGFANVNGMESIFIEANTTFENARTGSNNDYLSGNAQANELDGGAGDDVVWGYAGNDRLFGGEGKDQLIADVGNDYLDGGPGNDLLDGGSGDDVLYGGVGDDTIQGRDGFDIAVFPGRRVDYTISVDRSGLVVDLRSRTSEYDTAAGVEILRFSDSEYTPADLVTSAGLANFYRGGSLSDGYLRLGEDVVLRFDQPVFTHEGDIRLLAANGLVLASLSVSDATRVQALGNMIVLNLDGLLAPNTQYRLEVTPGAVVNVIGNAASDVFVYGQTNELRFVTESGADNRRPTIVSSTASGSFADQPSRAALVIGFSEDIAVGTGNIQIRRSSDAGLVESIPVTDAARVRAVGSLLEIQPSIAQPANYYYVVLEANSVRDLAGNLWLDDANAAGPILFKTGGLADDHGGSRMAATAITTAAATRATIELPLDQDWFRVQLSAGQSYRVQVTGEGSLKPTVRLFDEQRRPLAVDMNVDHDTRATAIFTPTASAAYFVEVSGHGSTGNYGLTVAVADVAAPLVTGWQPADGERHRDPDRGITVTFNEDIVAGNGLIRLLRQGAPAVEIAASDASQVTVGARSLTLVPRGGLMDGASYRVELAADAVRDLSGNPLPAAAASGAVSFTVPADDYAQLPATAVTLALGGTGLTGAIETVGDIDVFRVQLTAGIDYLFSIQQVASDTLGDPILVVLNKDFQRLIEVDDNIPGSNYPEVPFKAAETGAYFLAISGYADSVGGYRVVAARAADTTPPVITAWQPADGQPYDRFAGINVTFSEEISAGGGSIRITRPGASAIDIAASDATQVFVNGNRLSVFPPDVLADGASHRIELTAGAVRDVAGNPLAATASNAVTLTVPEHPSGPTGAATLGTRSARADGAIGTPGDVDVFQVALTAGINYRIVVEPARVGSIGDPILVLHNKDFQRLLEVDDNMPGSTFPEIIFTATETATYYVAVSGYSDSIGSYGLRAQEHGKPVFGTEGNDRLAAVGDSTLMGLGGNDLLRNGAADVLDGGLGFDIADYRASRSPTLGIDADLGTGLVRQGTQGSIGVATTTDRLISIEALFGTPMADQMRGVDTAAAAKGETFRGGGGNDSIDGRGGVDTVEFTGVRAGYSVTRAGSTITVRDLDLTVDEGTDTLVDIERLMFSDRMLAFGTRAEEVARVSFVLWKPSVITNSSLYGIGFNYYDQGFTFDDLCAAALSYWPQQGADLANLLLQGTPGTRRTVNDIMAIMAAAGGGESGRVAAVKAMAFDPATDANLAATNVAMTGIVADLNGSIALLGG